MRLSAKARRFQAYQGGATVVMFGLTLPIMVIAVSAALQYTSLADRRATLREAADTAAQAAAAELLVPDISEERIDAVARSAAAPMLKDITAPDGGSAITTEIFGHRSAVRIIIRAQAPGWMGKAANRGEAAEMTATAVGRIGARNRFCFVSANPHKDMVAHVDHDAGTTAKDCAMKDLEQLSHPGGARLLAAVKP